MANPSLEHLTSGIKQLIAEGEIEQAIEQLKNYLHSTLPQSYNDVLLQASRYSRLLRSERTGLITREQFEVDQTKISRSLLALLDELPRKIDRKLSPLGVDIPLIAKAESIPKGITPEKILGINNLKQISWIERGVQVSKSVCRILTPDGVGTGFLVGSQTIMTNNHVIPTADVAATTVIEFDYQQDGSGKLLPAFRYPLEAERFHTSEALDYTFVDVKAEAGKPPLETWGVLELNPNADPIPLEHVTIVQHPNGGLKQIVLTSNWVVDIKSPVLHYTTDTMAGSSGSPVFNDSWHVVAIHHAAVAAEDQTRHQYVNEGILMSAIKLSAGGFWPSQRG
ncbi:MAG TPA: trypsin-like peptidase domain-containing protein [Pyrinomonadaceae bacterium]|nr:trypsin-like peptidase domain-containing protein [Pyrinomonadaceae bacterium]